MDYAKESLRLHREWKGKIEVVATVPVANKDDLSLAYTPGVAQPCLEIQKDVEQSYELTRRGCRPGTAPPCCPPGPGASPPACPSTRNAGAGIPLRNP